MNRNWYNAPLQGGSRSTHDYGNSGPIYSGDDLYPVSWKERIIVSVVILGVTFALVAFWPA